jgi:hypothetical protein
MHTTSHQETPPVVALRIIRILMPSDERYKLGRDVNSELVLIFLMTTGTFSPQFPEFNHITSLLTFGCCISSKAGEVNKSGI